MFLNARCGVSELADKSFERILVQLPARMGRDSLAEA